MPQRIRTLCESIGRGDAGVGGGAGVAGVGGTPGASPPKTYRTPGGHCRGRGALMGDVWGCGPIVGLSGTRETNSQKDDAVCLTSS